MKEVKIIIKGMETSPLIWDSKKYSLFSFAASVLNAAYQVSNKDTTTELTLNGKNFEFPLGKINPALQALPKVEKLAINGSKKELIKRNFIGFVLTEVLGDVASYKGLNIHKDKEINQAAVECTDLIALIEAVTYRFRKAKKEVSNSKKQGRNLAVKYDTGRSLEELKEESKQLDAAYTELITPKQISAATVKNEQTKAKREEKTPA